MAPVRAERALGVELGAAALDPTRKLARRRVLPGRHVALRELVAAARAERGGALGSRRRVVLTFTPVCVPASDRLVSCRAVAATPFV